MRKTTNKFSPEVRARAVRLFFGSRRRAQFVLGGGHIGRGEDHRDVGVADAVDYAAGHDLPLDGSYN